MKQSDKKKGESADLSKGFDKLYLMYFSRMLRFAKGYVSSEEDAENLVQDIFATLWERKDELNLSTLPGIYLFSLLKNRCIDYLRRRTVEEEYKCEYALKMNALQRMNDSFRSEEEVERLVREALLKLPNRCREIFLKSRFEGKKYRDIADELDLSVSTVETQMNIALKRLRLELRDLLPLFFFLF